MTTPLVLRHEMEIRGTPLSRTYGLNRQYRNFSLQSIGSCEDHLYGADNVRIFCFALLPIHPTHYSYGNFIG